MAADDLSPTKPALNLTQAYRNASSSPLPADHPWYVDLSPAREPDLKPQILFRFEVKRPVELRDRQEVVYLESNLELNSSEFSLPELLLVMAVKVEQHFREQVKRPLPRRVMTDLMEWFAKVTREDVKSRTVEAGLEGSGSLPDYVPFFRSIQTLLKFRSEAARGSSPSSRSTPRSCVRGSTRCSPRRTSWFGQINRSVSSCSS